MRKLIIFLVVALVVVAMAVPAFASELNSYDFPIVGGILGDYNAVVPAPAPGSYNVVVYDANNNVIGETVSDVAYTNGYFRLNVDGIYNGIVVRLDMTITNNLELDYVYYGDLLEIDDGNIIGPIGINGNVVFSPVSSEPVSVADAVGTVFSGMGIWLVSALGSLVAIFWTGTSLTIVGVLSVCALAVAFGLFIIYLIRTFW